MFNKGYGYVYTLFILPCVLGLLICLFHVTVGYTLTHAHTYKHPHMYTTIHR